MAYVMIMLILLLILCTSVNSDDPYLISNFDLNPDFVILNSTSITRFLCTKQKDDNQDFEITTVPRVSSDNLRIYENRLNNTAIEIIIDSMGYIGAFNLICSSIRNQSVGIRSDILIGASPDKFTHVDRCIVYENKYIDCTIRAPIMVSAIHNQYPYYFNFMEIHQSLRADDVYNQPPELVKTDGVNKTITFRWLPVEAGIFPSGLKMLISGTLRYFDSTNFTIDMTPNFWIKSNFTIEVLSSSYIQIHFNHDLFSLPVFCHGNLTIDEKSKYQNQDKDSRIFQEANPTTIDITNLTQNTWYKICFQCWRNGSVNTISEIQCIRRQTKQAFNWIIYLIILDIVIITLTICIIAYAISGSECCIKKRIRNCKKSGNNSENNTRNVMIELSPVNSDLSQPIDPLLTSTVTTDDITRETTTFMLETSL